MTVRRAQGLVQAGARRADGTGRGTLCAPYPGMPTPRHTHADLPLGRNFHPPHCPNRVCRFHRRQSDWTWRRNGNWLRKDGRRFQSFQCLTCRRYFSIRTFSGTYWLRYRRLYPHLAARAAEGPGLRQEARVREVSHATVQRHLARAGRAALLFHQRSVRTLPVREELVIDGFETFEFSQYYPFHLNLAVGADSWFLYGFTDSPLRRKGRMTPAQKARRAQLETIHGRPDPKAVENGMVELLRMVVRQDRRPGSRSLEQAAGAIVPPPLASPAPGTPDETSTPTARVVHSDDHPAYRRALRRLESEGLVFAHHITSSRARRTTRNSLFPVNLADLLLRHGQANHRRETIAFSKRRQGVIGRCALFQFWRNWVKSRRENQPGETPAMRLRLAQRPLSWRDLLRRRRFPREGLLPGPWKDYYWHRVKTLALGDRQREHRLKYAF